MTAFIVALNGLAVRLITTFGGVPCDSPSAVARFSSSAACPWGDAPSAAYEDLYTFVTIELHLFAGFDR